MYYEDRLNGGGFARVLLAGGARLPAAPNACAAVSRSGCACRVEAVDPRGARRLQRSDRRLAGAARRAGAAGRRAGARTEGAPSDAARQSLDAAVLQRARGRACCSPRWRRWRVGLTLFNAYEVVRLPGAEPRLAADTIAQQRRAGARAARDKAAVIRRSIDRDAARRGAGGGAGGQSLIDQPRVLVDRTVQQFEATLPPDVRIAGVSRRSTTTAGGSCRSRWSRGGSRISKSSSTRSRRPGRSRRAVACREPRGGRHAAVGAPGLLHGAVPAATTPPAASEPGKARAAPANQSAGAVTSREAAR